MADESKKKVPPDNRLEYEAPRATRLRDMQRGSAQATTPCQVTGSGASGLCAPSGSSALSGCDTGNNFRT